jgi:hypothetical protein
MSWSGETSVICCGTRRPWRRPSGSRRSVAGTRRNSRRGGIVCGRGRRRLAQQLERLTEAYLGGVIPLPEYERRRAEIGVRGASLAEQERRLSGEADRLNEALGLAASLEAFCERVSTGLENATFDQRRQLVELLIDRVVVTGDEIEIRYVLPTSPQSEHVRFCVRRGKARIFSGCNSRPATRSLQPVALGAAVEVTKPPEPSIPRAGRP